VARSRVANSRELHYLEEELRRRDVPFVPSVANFVLVQVRPSGEEIAGRLLREGVIVRPMAAYGYPDAIRVTVGSRAETARFLTAPDRALLAGAAHPSRPSEST